eukprot:m.364486 g.364486  ORF g.364486 m.364486 type:complete len:59 (+) comp56039_c0_seq2:120-296(+)
MLLEALELKTMRYEEQEGVELCANGAQMVLVCVHSGLSHCATLFRTDCSNKGGDLSHI